MIAKLQRFWFRFEAASEFSPVRLGCGVTAYTYDDAVSILRGTVFKGAEMLPVAEVIEDVDVSSLDQRHVVPNMDPPVLRGVWFPKGYSFYE